MKNKQLFLYINFIKYFKFFLNALQRRQYLNIEHLIFYFLFVLNSFINILFTCLHILTFKNSHVTLTHHVKELSWIIFFVLLFYNSIS